MVKFLDLKKQYKNIKDEVDKTIQNVINDTAFVGGKYVEKFENNFASYHNAKYCIGVGNGTDALQIALWSLDLPKNSEVIVPANSFIATSEAVTLNNLKIVFADCKDDYTISPKSIKKLITKNTSCIIPVHLYGQPCDMDKIVKIAKKYKLKIIEDSAQAHGAIYKGQKIGTFGDLATFSFYPGKNLGAYGDGGAIITNDKILENRCKMYSNHGRSSKFAHEVEGINSRLDGIQAAILDVKLKHLDEYNNARQKAANYYNEKFNDCTKITTPAIFSHSNHIYHQYTLKIENADRDALKDYLLSKEIPCAVYYPVPLHLQKAYQHYGFSDADFPVTNQLSKVVLSLPMHTELEKEQLDYISSHVLEFLTK